MADKGFVLILSAPSGAGKSTLARILNEQVDGILTSISTTTRQPRGGEQEGEAYFFVDSATFKAQIAAGEFLEWAEVYGNYYGTSCCFINDAIERGEVVVLDIDWQGARQVRQSLPVEDVVTVSILPPAYNQLLMRLQSRGQDSDEVITRRMAQAGEEISHWEEYDYIVVNDELESAGADLVAIVRAERLRRFRAKVEIGKILATFKACQ